MDSTNCLNPSDWIQELFMTPSDWIQAYLCLVTDICYQDEVLPVIEDYRPQPGQPFEAPMNRFHSEWQNWLSKVQGCLFPRQKKSGYYRNMTFDNDSAAALGKCQCESKFLRMMLTLIPWFRQTRFFFLV